jgi:hypothetical protein
VALKLFDPARATGQDTEVCFGIYMHYANRNEVKLNKLHHLTDEGGGERSRPQAIHT